MGGKEKHSNQKTTGKSMDNPEQYPTEKESLFDKFESEQTVDSIPMEDLNMEKEEEKDGPNTKDQSSTEKKYKQDFDNNR
ncbi:hypothetical protein [Mesobacillus harenae]|uniref:hypothetical protein n=1 Tax=Mesobacillus harenae TaxID=2213203 RepID=UPI00158012AF|nr:hypothetical protein [Mesobacillus harenae]